MTLSRPSNAGLTLTELIVVTTIFTMLSGMVYATIRYQTHTYRIQTAQTSGQTKLRYWMGQMVKDIRRAGFNPHEKEKEDVFFGITVAEPTEIRFTTDLDSDGTLSSAAETSGYRFEDGTIFVLRGAAWRPLITGVADFLLVYRDSQGNVVAGEPVGSVEIAVSVEATTASFEGRSTATGHTPAIDTVGERTTIDIGEGGAAGPVLTRIGRARVRNFR